MHALLKEYGMHNIINNFVLLEIQNNKMMRNILGG